MGDSRRHSKSQWHRRDFDIRVSIVVPQVNHTTPCSGTRISCGHSTQDLHAYSSHRWLYARQPEVTRGHADGERADT
jgi:hypothetical protein